MSFTQLTERAWGPLAQVFLPVRGFLVPLALSGVVEVGRRACRRALLARLRLSFIIRRGGGMNTRVSFVFVGGGECQPPNYSRYSRVIREYSPDSRAQRMPTYTYDEA